MEINPIFIIIYAGFVFLHGIMAYLTGDAFGILEISLGLAFFLLLPWMKNKTVRMIGLSIAIVLLIYYCFAFAATTLFFGAALGGSSFFMSIYLALKTFP
jgi:hypothetical protein